MESLRKQLERTRLERALEVVESMAQHRVLLTTTELARLNGIATGRRPEEDSWRQEAITLSLPSGEKETLALIADPKQNVRERLHKATELAEGGSVLDAVIHVYTGLVLSHPFADANRRTAALAAHYFLQRYDVPLSGMALYELGLGDLRRPGQLEALRETLGHMARFANKRQG